MYKNFTAAWFLKDELSRLKLLHKNFRGICQIVVFDGGSSDGSEEYCLQNKIRFISKPNAVSWEERTKLIQWCLNKIETKYVLIVYAAHFYPKSLLDKFGQISNKNELDAVFHNVVIYRYGETVHRAFFRRIPSVCNFFNKEIFKSNNPKIHDEWHIDFDSSNMTKLEPTDDLSLHLFQDEDSISFAKKTINYIEIEAKQKFDEGLRVSFANLLFQPLLSAIFRYIRTGAILYGSKGLVYTYLNFVYDLTLQIRIWELTHSFQRPNAQDLNAKTKKKYLESDDAY